MNSGQHVGAPIPYDEPRRLEALRALQVLDTSQDPLFQRIVQLASQILGTPISLVSLVDADRQWFKANVGLSATETPRDVAFCAHAILSDVPLIVEDAAKDERFSSNPLVLGAPHIRFYAGAPLVSADGYRLGTLCVIDTQPRQINASQVSALQTLAAMAVDALHLRSELAATGKLLRKSQEDVRDRSLFLSSFGHELRTPLHQVIGFAEVIEQDRQDFFSRDKIREYVSIIRQSAHHLFQVIDGIVRLERAAYGADLDVVSINIETTVLGVVRSFETMVRDKHQRLIFLPSDLSAQSLVDETALRQILVNLISNACKYSPEGATIKVSIHVDGAGDKYILEVADTGPGIPDELLRQLGKPYLQAKDVASRHGGGIGLGLRITKQLANAMHCDLQFAHGSKEGGTIARLVIPISRTPMDGVAGRTVNR